MTVAPGEPCAGVRVKTHPGLCAGHGLCHRFAPDVYSLDENGEVAVQLLDVPAEHALAAWRGASVCPEGAITVIGPPEAHWVARVAADVDAEPPTYNIHSSTIRKDIGP